MASLFFCNGVGSGDASKGDLRRTLQLESNPAAKHIHKWRIGCILSWVGPVLRTLRADYNHLQERYMTAPISSIRRRTGAHRAPLHLRSLLSQEGIFEADFRGGLRGLF